MPMSTINEPKEFAIKITNLKGKHAGMLNVTLQLYTGDIQVALNLMKQTQASNRRPVVGGGFSQPVQQGGGGFTQPMQQQTAPFVAGGFQQPSTAPAVRPIGGFTLSGKQQAGGAGASRDHVGFSTPPTITANSQGFQGHHQQHNLMERGDYIPQAGASCDGQSSYPVHSPQPIYTPTVVIATSTSADVVSSAPPAEYLEEDMPLGEKMW